MHFSILTIFPDLLDSPLEEGIIRRARKDERVTIDTLDIRSFTEDKHQVTDDRPYGGGEGMVMKPEPLQRAVQQARKPGTEKERVILLSPQGTVFNQAVARELGTMEHLILVCGRYEGVDERFTRNHVDMELSIGDYVLSGGELGALVVIDAVTRLVPGVLGCPDSAGNDSFSRNLLKHPQYTRPRVFEEVEVPAVLLSGDHERISEFRFVASVDRTLKRRPDLLYRADFSQTECKTLKKHGLWGEVEPLTRRGTGR